VGRGVRVASPTRIHALDEGVSLGVAITHHCCQENEKPRTENRERRMTGWSNLVIVHSSVLRSRFFIGISQGMSHQRSSFTP
jgi:hypothetical protein